MRKTLCAALSAWVLLQSLCMAGDLSYSVDRNTSPLEMGKRKRALDKPVIVVQPEYMYGPYHNYLNFFTDRPLFYNRDIRDIPGNVWSIKKEGFKLEVDLLRKYEMNGWAPFGKTSWGEAAVRWTDELNEKDVLLSPSLDWTGKMTDLNSKDYKDAVEELNYFKQFPRRLIKVGDKILVSTYTHWGLDQGKARHVADKLREETGDDMIVMSFVSAKKLVEEWYTKKAYSQEALDGFKENIQTALDNWGGVLINPTGDVYEENGSGDLGFKFDKRQFASCSKAVLEVMGRERNKGRLLGVANAAAHGYINPFSGLVWGEYGTSLLRQYFEGAMALNADYVILCEWSEFNENTCIMPTIANSMATQRLVKFYARKMRGQKPEANEGDDTSIPNLVLSNRRKIRLGEVIRFELLNIPDSESDRQYSAALILKDEKGRIIKSFPPEKFVVGDLTAVTYKIPSEQLAGQCVVQPELEVTDASGAPKTFTGFHHVEIEPTTCRDYKEVKMPLRDLLKPVKADFAVKDKGNGNFQISGQLEADEELNSLEVLDQDREVFAVDKADEFKLKENVLFYFRFNIGRRPSPPIECKINVENSTNWIFSMSEEHMRTWRLKRTNGEISGRFTSDHFTPHGFFISVPKADVENAVVSFILDGKPAASVKIDDVSKREKMAFNIPEKTARIDVERMRFLADIPVSIKAKTANFSADIKSTKKFPILQMRAVSSSGKIYCSAPVVPIAPSGPRTTLNVFSDTEGRPLEVQEFQERIPDLRYQFTPEYGALLRNNYDPFWDAQLGGGFIYGEAFYRGFNLKADKNLAPEWKKDGAEWVLSFNGDTQYMAFPQEALPQTAFTLECDVRFDDDNRTEAIFRHVPLTDGGGSLHLYRHERQLHAAYFGRKWQWNRDNTGLRYNTGLKLPAGEWLKLKVAYDLEKITFSVGNEKVEYRLYGDRAGSYKPAVFGGPLDKPTGLIGDNASLKNFKGQLKTFRIKHNGDGV